MSKKSHRAVVPVEESDPVISRRLQRWLIGGTTGLVFCAATIGTFIVADGPAWLGAQAASATARAGFSLNKVVIHGMNYTSSLDVHTALGAEQGAILFADLDSIRSRVKNIPWVAEASVQRKLPDRLEIRIKERVPFAIWQRRGQLDVIDRAGVPLTRARLDRFGALPIVVGDNAQKNAAKLFDTLAQTENLRGQLDSAVWVGNRRWNIRFRSGEVLMLPEGEKLQKSAISAFSQLQSGYHLLGRGEAHFDMRLGDRLFVGRVSGEQAKEKSPPKTETSI
jgi:cell division protein FtsQ